MIKRLIAVIALFCFTLSLLIAQTSGPAYIKGLLTGENVFNTPSYSLTSDYDEYRLYDNIQGLFIDGLDYQGDSTKVFCWYGIPETI